MKKIFLSLFVLFGVVNSSFAVELPGLMKQSMSQNAQGMPSLLHLFVSMILVIGMIYLTGWIYAKLNIVNRKKIGKINEDAESARFTVLQSMPLGQQRHIYSIEMNGKILLVGSTPSHINLIKEFDKDGVAVEGEKPVSEIPQESFVSVEIEELYKKYKS